MQIRVAPSWTSRRRRVVNFGTLLDYDSGSRRDGYFARFIPGWWFVIPGTMQVNLVTRWLWHLGLIMWSSVSNCAKSSAARGLYYIITADRKYHKLGDFQVLRHRPDVQEISTKDKVIITNNENIAEIIKE